MNRALFALLASFAVASALGESPEQTKVRITTWNLEWFPNGSAHDAAPELQAQRIAAAADVLRPINPDIILLQEVRDYEACARLGEAIGPGMYQIAICSAFKEPFQSGLGKQQVAILSKYQAQAAWSEPWKSMNGVDPPRGFAFARFKIGSEEIGIYSLHLKSNRIIFGNKEIETAKNIRKREVSIHQLVAHIRDVIGTVIPSVKGLIIGGDFNTNHDQAMFAAERTLDSLTSAAYQSVFEAALVLVRPDHVAGIANATRTAKWFKKNFGRPRKSAVSKTYAQSERPIITSQARARAIWSDRANGLTQRIALGGDGKRFVVHANEKLTAFMELESVLRLAMRVSRPFPP